MISDHIVCMAQFRSLLTTQTNVNSNFNYAAMTIPVRWDTINKINFNKCARRGAVKHIYGDGWVEQQRITIRPILIFMESSLFSISRAHRRICSWQFELENIFIHLPVCCIRTEKEETQIDGMRWSRMLLEHVHLVAIQNTEQTTMTTARSATRHC